MFTSVTKFEHYLYALCLNISYAKEKKEYTLTCDINYQSIKYICAPKSCILTQVYNNIKKIPPMLYHGYQKGSASTRGDNTCFIALLHIRVLMNSHMSLQP